MLQGSTLRTRLKPKISRDNVQAIVLKLHKLPDKFHASNLKKINKNEKNNFRKTLWKSVRQLHLNRKKGVQPSFWLVPVEIIFFSWCPLVLKIYFISNAQTNASVVFTKSEPFILNQNGEKSRFKSDSSSEFIFTAFVVKRKVIHTVRGNNRLKWVIFTRSEDKVVHHFVKILFLVKKIPSDTTQF